MTHYLSSSIQTIAVQSAEGLAKIGKAANIYGAPLAIIVCADHNKAWVRPFDQKQTGDIDASILTDHMMLQATELGLGFRFHLLIGVAADGAARLCNRNKVHDMLSFLNSLMADNGEVFRGESAAATPCNAKAGLPSARE